MQLGGFLCRVEIDIVEGGSNTSLPPDFRKELQSKDKYIIKVNFNESCLISF